VPVMGVPKFERFFREAASLDVDKDDIKRYSDFVNEEIYDLLLIGQATAKANSRDVIERWDLPITKGLQESIHNFRKMDQDIELEPILDELAARPQLDVTLSEETTADLPRIAGGVSVALARAFKLLDTRLENPSSEHWDRAFQLFRLLM
jgi:hypothetical protein